MGGRAGNRRQDHRGPTLARLSASDNPTHDHTIDWGRITRSADVHADDSPIDMNVVADGDATRSSGEWRREVGFELQEVRYLSFSY